MAAAFTCTGIRTCVDTYLRWHLHWNLCNGRI
jgi:hypothetical protein